MSETRSILIVEDNEHNRLLYGTALREQGYQVIEAPSGETALLLGALHEPDLILLDIGLPGVSGLSVASQLRGNPELRDTPIIAVTAQPLHHADLAGTGIDHLIRKPINPFDLAAQVTAWWNQRQSAGPGSADPADPAEPTEPAGPAA